MQPLQIGVCTWSLAKPSLGEALAAVKDDVGLNVVHLGFFFGDGAQQPEEVAEVVQSSGIEVSAAAVAFDGEDYATIQRIAETGGYMPDDDWENRLARTEAVADVTRQLRVPLLSTHVGFIPHEPSDRKYGIMVDRVKKVCDVLGQRGLTFIMETGQEHVDALLAFIEAVGRENLGVNFDPANMILYGVGDPVEAVGKLGRYLRHVHMKDGRASAKPGQDWGEEVVLGTGEANIPFIVEQLKGMNYVGPLVIEREAGDDRVGDIRKAVKLLASLGT